MEINRKELEKTLSEKIAKLKALCNDAHYSDKLINDILSIKSQLDIEPTYIHIPLSDVCKDEDGNKMEIDFKYFTLLKTKKGIIVSVNGYKIIVSSWIKSLYDQLNFLIEYHAKYDSFSDEEKGNYDTIVSGTMNILLCPLTCFFDDDWIDLATDLTRRQNDMFEKYLEYPLQEDNEEENETFRADLDFAEELRKSAKEGNIDNPFDNA